MAQSLSHLTAYVGEGGREDGSNSVSSDCLCGRGETSYISQLSTLFLRKMAKVNIGLANCVYNVSTCLQAISIL